jgi:hypothetical protein
MKTTTTAISASNIQSNPAIRCLGLVMLAALASGLAEGQGMISGTVVDTHGNTVPGATIYYNNVPTLSPRGAPIGPVVHSTATADGSGHFSLGGLSLGKYYLCAGGTQQNQLRSCDWDLPLIVSDLTETSPVASVTMALGDGCQITMTIADPGNKVNDRWSSSGAPNATGNLVLGVARGTWYAVMRPLASTTAGGLRSYAVTVPKHSQFTVQLTTVLPFAANISATGVTSLPGLAVVTADSDITINLGSIH